MKGDRIILLPFRLEGLMNTEQPPVLHTSGELAFTSVEAYSTSRIYLDHLD